MKDPAAGAPRTQNDFIVSLKLLLFSPVCFNTRQNSLQTGLDR
jgi:hypothetical protein